MSNKIIVISILLLGLILNLNAVEVKKKEVKDYKTFQKGKFVGTSLDSKGGLFIGPGIKRFTGPDEEYYLSLSTTANGDIYIGTGHKASVYKLNPKAPAPAAATGQPAPVEKVFSSEDLDVYALLAQDNGTLYVGTSPDGKLYKVTPGKDKKDNVKTLFDPEEKFIWDIKRDNSGNLILATGNSGGIYRIVQGKVVNAVKIFSAEDTHIISLYVTRGNSILAGSGDRGILYKIDNTKAKVLFDSPFEEIRGICEDKHGNIYFSATRDIQKQNVLSNASVEIFLDKKKKDEKLEPVPPQKSMLYCRRTDGVVEKIWYSYTEYIYSLCYDAQTDTVLVGTGNSGRVYRVDKDGGFSIVYESDAAQVFKLEPAAGGTALITNNTASTAQIMDILNSKGVYLSEIFDLGIQSRLGKIYWNAEAGSPSDVSLFVRTGNSNVPDDTWGKWSAPFTDSANANINVSGVRYFQVKAVLNATNPSSSPKLNQFKVYYIQSNLKPRLLTIDIAKPNTKKPPVIIVSSSGQTETKPQKKPVTNHYLDVKWRALDPNKDKLKYNIHLKKITDRNWLLVEENITKAQFKLNTRLFEDGRYRLRVTADDALANPPGMSREASLVSAPFLVDSTAPTLTGLAVQDREVRFTVTDQTSIVAKVLFSFDGQLWFPVFPVDSIADSKSEQYRFKLTNVPSGQRHIFIKAMDEFDNSKVFQKEF